MNCSSSKRAASAGVHMRASSATLFPLNRSNTPWGTYRYSHADCGVDPALHHAIAARAFRGTSRALSVRLKEHDVSYSQWTLLRVLWQADGLTQRELSDEAGADQPHAGGGLDHAP